MDGWINGSMDQWINGSMDQWINGSMDQWMDQWQKGHSKNADMRHDETS
jgi:hypothetical protein